MQASKEIGRPIVHEFTREALIEAGAAHVVPPFSVVASNTMDLSVGRSDALLTPHCLLSQCQILSLPCFSSKWKLQCTAMPEGDKYQDQREQLAHDSTRSASGAAVARV